MTEFKCSGVIARNRNQERSTRRGRERNVGTIHDKIIEEFGVTSWLSF